MPYIPFDTYCNDLAEKETRSVTLLSDDNEFGLPAGDYGFVEMFCDECDCRRVFFLVLKEGVPEPIATIFWGWETVKFYKRWYGSSNINVKADLIGPAHNMTSPRTVYTNGVLKLISQLLLKDRNYVERIKRHYQLFRQQVRMKKM